MQAIAVQKKSCCSQAVFCRDQFYLMSRYNPVTVNNLNSQGGGGERGDNGGGGGGDAIHKLREQYACGAWPCGPQAGGAQARGARTSSNAARQISAMPPSCELTEKRLTNFSTVDESGKDWECSSKHLRSKWWTPALIAAAGSGSEAIYLFDGRQT